MTDPNKTSIVVILDRSASMQGCATKTVEGFNSFLAEQKELKGACSLTLVQFADTVDTCFIDTPIKTLSPMWLNLGQCIYESSISLMALLGNSPVLERSLMAYHPFGASTSLYDAIGTAVQQHGARLRALPENERPGKVIVVIITDGMENSSKTFSGPKIQKMLQHQQDVYSWQVLYLGANQDAIQVGQTIGVKPCYAATYSVDNMREAWTASSLLVSNCRDTGVMGADGPNGPVGFSSTQRAALVNA